MEGSRVSHCSASCAGPAVARTGWHPEPAPQLPLLLTLTPSQPVDDCPPSLHPPLSEQAGGQRTRERWTGQQRALTQRRTESKAPCLSFPLPSNMAAALAQPLRPSAAPPSLWSMESLTTWLSHLSASSILTSSLSPLSSPSQRQSALVISSHLLSVHWSPTLRHPRWRPFLLTPALHRPLSLRASSESSPSDTVSGSPFIVSLDVGRL